MKILYVLDTFYPKIDGPATVINNLATIYNINNIVQIDVLAPYYPKYKDNFPFKIIRCPSIFGPDNYRAGMPFLNPKLNKILKRGNYDIIHIHSPFTVGKYALKFGLKNNIPVINTVHTKYKSDFERTLKSKTLQNFMMRYIRKVLNNSDYVLTVSNTFADELESNIYQCRKKVGVIRNATEFKDRDFTDLISDLRKKYQLSNEFLFLSVGRVVENKNIQFSLETLKNLKELGFNNFKFFIIGEGDYLEHLKTLAKKYNIENNVIFVGLVKDRNLLSAYYKLCDLFLFPSVFDTCGIVALEAGSFGLPSFMIKDSCASELINDEQNGFVEIADSKLWATRLFGIVSNKNKLKNMKQITKSTLTKSWEDIALEYFVLYKGVLFFEKLKTCKESKLLNHPITSYVHKSKNSGGGTLLFIQKTIRYTTLNAINMQHNEVKQAVFLTKKGVKIHVFFLFNYKTSKFLPNAFLNSVPQSIAYAISKELSSFTIVFIITLSPKISQLISVTLPNPVTSRASAILSITESFLTAIKSSSVRYSLNLTHSLKLKLSEFLPSATKLARIISVWLTPKISLFLITSYATLSLFSTFTLYPLLLR